LFGAFFRGLRAVVMAVLIVFGPLLARAATPLRMVADPQSGIALYGFDPVAYFTEGQPALGAADFEYRYAGVSWRFRNEGNRAAFATNPEIYAPRFGGYDPLGVARGVAMPGHPQLWVRRDDRIYLFHREETRAAFIADPATALAAADGRWPQVANELPQ
jgi:YHS domain-containing protein